MDFRAPGARGSHRRRAAPVGHGARAAVACPMPSDPPEVVREVVRRFQAGESVGALFAPDYQVVGTPAPTLPSPRRDDVDDRVATMRTEGLDAQVREIIPGVDGRVVVRSVWRHHDEGGGGSAFLVHAVMTAREGRLVETRYFATQGEAERYAGVVD